MLVVKTPLPPAFVASYNRKCMSWAYVITSECAQCQNRAAANCLIEYKSIRLITEEYLLGGHKIYANVCCVCGASNMVRLRFISHVLLSLHSQRKVTPRIVEQFVWKCLSVAASQRHRHTTTWNPRNVTSRLCRICGNTLGMVIWAEALIDVAYVQGVAVFTRITHSVCAVYTHRMGSSGKSW